MQKKMEEVQEVLSQQVIEVSSGGGAVQIQITGQGEFKGLQIDPEFLKEDKEFVEETLLAAFQEAVGTANKVRETEMNKVTDGFSLPGLV